MKSVIDVYHTVLPPRCIHYNILFCPNSIHSASRAGGRTLQFKLGTVQHNFCTGPPWLQVQESNDPGQS